MEVLFSRQDLLIDGYANEITHKHNIHIPMDVKRILLAFFNEILVWIIDDKINKNWTDFIFTRNHNAYYSNKFVIHNIEFQCSLCPDGWNYNQFNQVQFYLELINLPIYIKSVIVFNQLYCKQTQTNWKNIRQFAEKGDAGSWYSSSLSKTEIEDLSDRRLDFYCYIEILMIEYNLAIDIKPITLKQHIMKINTNYIWFLDDVLLDKCKNAGINQPFFSDNFGADVNGNWCFSFIPNFKRKKTMMELRLLRLPIGINQIIINCKIVCYSDRARFIICDKITNMDYINNKRLKLEMYTEIMSKKTQKLSFQVRIFVVSVVSITGRKVNMKNSDVWLPSF